MMGRSNPVTGIFLLENVLLMNEIRREWPDSLNVEAASAKETTWYYNDLNKQLIHP